MNMTSGQESNLPLLEFGDYQHLSLHYMRCSSSSQLTCHHHLKNRQCSETTINSHIMSTSLLKRLIFFCFLKLAWLSFSHLVNHWLRLSTNHQSTVLISGSSTECLMTRMDHLQSVSMDHLQFLNTRVNHLQYISRSFTMYINGSSIVNHLLCISRTFTVCINGSSTECLMIRMDHLQIVSRDHLCSLSTPEWIIYSISMYHLQNVSVDHLCSLPSPK